MSCCPPASAPYLAADHSFKGTDATTSEGYNYYTSGSSVEAALIICPDVWGYHGGRTRNIADYYADQNMTVIVPQLLVPCLEGGVDGDGNETHSYSLHSFFTSLLPFISCRTSSSF
jgi:dienelactone hydrolase